MSTLIEVEKVWKYYGKLLVNEDISLYVNSGEIVSLLGPNGAGKTTLVKQIYGELKPDRGVIRVLNRDPNSIQVKRRMGIIPQETEPFEDLTVEDNIYYIGKLKGMSKGEVLRNLRALLEALGLEEHRKKLGRNLSGGLKRKLLIAMALVNDPDVVIMDEPTTGLDPISRREVWEILNKIRKDGRGILLTTHYMEEAERLSDRIYFINRKIIAQGKTHEIKEKFTSWYEVYDYSTGKVYKVRAEEIKEFLMKINGKFEVRLPSLEEIYLRVVKSD